jgi:hypothetical protein
VLERRAQRRRRLGEAAHAARRQRVVGEGAQRGEDGLQPAVEGDGAAQRRGAGPQRGGEVRRGGPQGADARPQLGEQPLGVAQERALGREGPDRGVQRGPPLGDRLLDERGDLAQRGEGRVEVREQVGLRLGHGRDLGRRAAERLDEAAQIRLGRGEVPGDGDHVGEQRPEGADRRVEVRAAACERGPEAVEVALHRLARAVVERVEELVELDLLGRRGRQRQGVAVLEALVGAAALDLHVLQAQRGARPHEHLGVDGQRGGGALELERQVREARAVLAAAGLDAVDRADPGAADAHLVAAHEVGRAGRVDPQLVGRDERQALVGVVGQEDGDDDHERRGRADQHRVAGDPARAPAPHRSSPPNR